MFTFFVFLLTTILICSSVFIIFVILMQRPSANSGLGSALGGGAAESVFGGETTKVLTKWTIYGTIILFISATVLSMMYVHHNSHVTKSNLPMLIENDNSL